MLQVVTCKECGKELSVKIEDMPKNHYDLVIRTYVKPCVVCWHSDDKKNTLSFCSEKCVKEYVRKM